MRNQFRKDIIQLSHLFYAFRDCEQFAPTDEETRAYQAYWDFLNALVIKYNKTPRQIASAINY